MSDFNDDLIQDEPQDVNNPDLDPKVPPLNFTGVNDDIVLLDDDAPDPEVNQPNVEELQRRLQEAEAKLQSMGQDNPTAQAVKELAQSLQQQRQQPQGPPVYQQQLDQQSEPISDDQLNEIALEKGWAEAMKLYDQKKTQPMMKEAVQDKLYFSERTISVDPERREFYNKYKGEIQGLINSTPLEVLYKLRDPYMEAYQRVMQNHQDDIQEEKLSRLVDERLKKMGFDPSKMGGQSRPQNVSFSETVTSRPSPRANEGQTRAIKLSQAERAAARSQGVSERDYAAFLLRHPERRQK